MSKLDAAYWNQRYLDENHPWDIGYASTPLVEYINQLEDKSMRILIPGAGNAWEAAYLFEKGFQNVFVLDWSAEVIAQFKANHPEFPDSQLIAEDFFEHQGNYDLILEQTFFCALPPAMRPAYVRQMRDLLKPGGKLTGLLFDFPLTEKGPPFGGSIEIYRAYFGQEFKIKTLERCYNSIKPRQGNELFLQLLRLA